ncbi:MAG: endonuclease/exonuclease/phosphatase family protein [Polyangiaceae bacterium]
MPLTLATYNVLDFFEATDAPSRAHLDRKLGNLAAVLTRANADVVALQEVGSAAVVKELTARVPELGYGEPIVGTADKRGIRCALVSRLPIVESMVHTAEHLAFPTFVAGDPPPFGTRIPLRRGIVRARIDAGELGPVDVLVAHFKSNRPLPLRDSRGEIPPVTTHDYAEAYLRSTVWRAAEALFVRGLVDDLLAANASRHVAVTGDLNDHPLSSVLRVLAGGAPAELVPCADMVPEQARFSILHHGKRQQIDHILVTRPLRERLQSAQFLNEGLKDHGELGPNAPPLPESDHAPLVVSFA